VETPWPSTYLPFVSRILKGLLSRGQCSPGFPLSLPQAFRLDELGLGVVRHQFLFFIWKPLLMTIPYAPAESLNHSITFPVLLPLLFSPPSDFVWMRKEAPFSRGPPN